MKTKFKPGDTVRRIGPDNPPILKDGVYTVCHTTAEGLSIMLKGYEYSYSSINFELASHKTNIIEVW